MRSAILQTLAITGLVVGLGGWCAMAYDICLSILFPVASPWWSVPSSHRLSVAWRRLPPIERRRVLRAGVAGLGGALPSVNISLPRHSAKYIPAAQSNKR